MLDRNKTMKFQVNFYEKKSKDIINTQIVESDNDIGIRLKAKIQALGEGFKYDKRKHDSSFITINSICKV